MTDMATCAWQVPHFRLRKRESVPILLPLSNRSACIAARSADLVHHEIALQHARTVHALFAANASAQ